VQRASLASGVPAFALTIVSPQLTWSTRSDRRVLASWMLTCMAPVAGWATSIDFMRHPACA